MRNPPIQEGRNSFKPAGAASHVPESEVSAAGEALVAQAAPRACQVLRRTPKMLPRLACLNDAFSGLCRSSLAEEDPANEDRPGDLDSADEGDVADLDDPHALSESARQVLRAARQVVYEKMQDEVGAVTGPELDADENDTKEECTFARGTFSANVEELHCFLMDMELRNDRATLSVYNLNRLHALHKRLVHLNSKDPELDKDDAALYVVERLEQQMESVFGSQKENQPPCVVLMVHLLQGAYFRLLSESQILGHAAVSLSKALNHYTLAVELAHGRFQPPDVLRMAPEVEYCIFARTSLHEIVRSNALFYAAITTGVNGYAHVMQRDESESQSPEDEDAAETFSEFMSVICEADFNSLFGCEPALLWQSSLSVRETEAARSAASSILRAQQYKWRLEDKEANEIIQRASGVNPAAAALFFESVANTENPEGAEEESTLPEAPNQPEVTGPASSQD